MSDLAALQARLGYTFLDEALLKLAVTHPSIAHDPPPHPGSVTVARRATQHNQRLEFLGDAVLQLVLTHELYRRFPEFEEGPLTKARAKLVNRRTLAVHARAVGLGDHLVLSRGEELHGGRERPSALADGYESLVGAIYLDGGFEAARTFILREFGAGLGRLDSLPILENPKGELQEFLQATSNEAPQYRVVSATGPDHDRVFECTVHFGGAELARGIGKSKKAAESEAALAALSALKSRKAVA